MVKGWVSSGVPQAAPGSIRDPAPAAWSTTQSAPSGPAVIAVGWVRPEGYGFAAPPAVTQSTCPLSSATQMLLSGPSTRSTGVSTSDAPTSVAVNAPAP